MTGTSMRATGPSTGEGWCESSLPLVWKMTGCAACDGTDRDNRPVKEPARALCAGNGALTCVLRGKEQDKNMSVDSGDRGREQV